MSGSQEGWHRFYGANAGYVVELYEQYRNHPEQLDPASREFFEQKARQGQLPPSWEVGIESATAHASAELSLPQLRQALALVDDLRRNGHQAVTIEPFASPRLPTTAFDLQARGLDPAGLAKLEARLLGDWAPGRGDTVLDVLTRLTAVYTGALGFEFEHLADSEARTWLAQRVEVGGLPPALAPDRKRRLLDELIAAEEFEQFLHTTFPGQKRFSLEGLDVLVPMLNQTVAIADQAEAEAVVVGMAHRGRLNVLANVFHKPAAAIIAEFFHNRDPHPRDSDGWTGDVKYHLGFASQRTGERKTLRLVMVNNPSHLEFVDPVAEGETRALQDTLSQGGESRQSPDRAIAVLIHGDAAMTGEGVVAETLNMSRIAGYQTGGTIHIISNNEIGFTAESGESRSTHHASDIVKGYDIPIVHLNADQPEAALYAVQLAFAYRQRFHRDFLIDVVGYRRWGHNEGDEPAFTQPQRYQAIAHHPTVAQIYGAHLESAGVLTPENVQAMRETIRQRLTAAHHQAAEGNIEETFGESLASPARPSAPPAPSAKSLLQWNQELLSVPEGFHMHPKLQRLIGRRRQGLHEGQPIDWAWAEFLAFASMLAEGIPIRMAGQDTERGTFSQRHLIWHDIQGGPAVSPLARFSAAKASFDVHNSPLSETAVLGFEYGYSIQSPQTLVLWEAQFGDFANVAQPIVDQFIAAARAKWRQRSGLVLLLPHGFEGQGPEHSSARLERYLQLAAEDNLYVANCTSAAQYFHLLRQHPYRTADRRPLVLMTPKSLLRHPLAMSTLDDLVHGAFQPILELPLASGDDQAVQRVVLATGKVAIDLKVGVDADHTDLEFLRVLRIEQLYPFPAAAIRAYLRRFPHLAEVVWLQEEPQNMGAWSFVQDKIRAVLPKGLPLKYIGRPERAGVATGYTEVHTAEQTEILRQALQPMPSRSKVRL